MATVESTARLALVKEFGHSRSVVAIQTPADAPSEQFEGSHRYAVLRALGGGAMGTVYEVRDRETGERLAVKVLLRDGPLDIYLFKREFRALADIVHPNLARLHELFHEGDSWFFTMDLIDGLPLLAQVAQTRPKAWTQPDPSAAATLDQAIWRRADPAFVDDFETLVPGEDYIDDADLVPPASKTRVSPDAVADIRSLFAQLAVGVQALHEHGFLHRDIKPSNALLRPDGSVVLVDFGLVTPIVADAQDPSLRGLISGTAAYMAPEQAQGLPTSAASDWYAVGAVLFEALTGRPPFVGSSTEMMSAKTNRDAPAVDAYVEGLPTQLLGLCRSMLSRDPTQRPNGPSILHALGAQGRQDQPQRSRRVCVGRDVELAQLSDQLATRGTFRWTVVKGCVGVGKSHLVRTFAHQTRRQGTALTLTGQCTSRERLPLRPIDGIVDDLVADLVCRHRRDVESILPRYLSSLVRRFPTLLRVPAISDRRGAEPSIAPAEAQRRAAHALREMLGMLSQLTPVVVFIEDIQWLDADSAALLRAVTLGPDAAEIYLITTMRSEAAGSAYGSTLVDAWPRASGQVVTLDTLGPAAASELARRLIPQADDDMVSDLVTQTQGHPLLIATVAQWGGANWGGRATVGADIRAAFAEREAALPVHARTLLHTIAVAGSPVALAIAAAAAEVTDQVTSLLSALRAAGLVEFLSTRVVACYHSTIGDAVVDALSPDRLRHCHAALAGAGQRAPTPDDAFIAVHLLASDQAAAALPFLRRAAAASMARLDFARAISLYQEQLAIDPSESRRHDVLPHLAASQFHSGYFAEAAAVYSEAAALTAPGVPHNRLACSAVDALFKAGDWSAGQARLPVVLRALGGVPAPKSAPRRHIRIMARLITTQRRLARPRRLKPGSAEKAGLRANFLFGLSLLHLMVDPIEAVVYLRDAVVAALDSGDSRAIACTQALDGVVLTGRRKLALATTRFEVAQARADLANDPATQAFVDIAKTLAAFLTGTPMHDVLEQAQANRRSLTEHGLMGTWMAGLLEVVRLGVMSRSGQIGDAAAETEALIGGARERRNRYLEVLYRLGPRDVPALAFDKPDAAAANIAAAEAAWAGELPGMLRYHAQRHRIDVAIYRGDGRLARQIVNAEFGPLRRRRLSQSRLHTFEIAVYRLRALLAVCSERRATEADLRSADHALAVIGRLNNMPMTVGFHQLLGAGVARLRDDDAAALVALKQAIDAFSLMPMVDVHVARAWQGVILGGDEGQLLTVEAFRALKTCGVVAPAKWIWHRLPMPGWRDRLPLQDAG
ncbi:MAG: serine/threonine protein kinase [Myxococcota bacterium]|jgi:serine/threonine protein kinase